EACHAVLGGARSRVRLPPEQHGPVQSHRAAHARAPVRVLRLRASRVLPALRAPVRRGHRAARRARLRAGDRVAHAAPARVSAARSFPTEASSMNLTRREVLKGAAALGVAGAIPGAAPTPARAQTTQKRELVVAQGG